MISRNCHKVVQQCLEYSNILQYFDNLKSRIYKAFFDKYRSKAYFLQSCFANSPLSTIIAVVYHVRITRLSLNSFELGYLIFCLSNNFFLDTSFYSYYRENFDHNSSYLFRYLAEKVRFTIVTWCIEPYRNYLCSKEDFLFYRNIQDSLSKLVDIQAANYRYVSLFNIRSCFSYFYLLTMIRRLSLHESMKQYFRKRLSNTAFSYLIFGLNFPIEHMLFNKSSISLLLEILNLLFFYASHEIHVALKTYCVLHDCMKFVSILNSGCTILIMDEDNSRYRMALKQLKNFLLFNGIKSKDVSSFCLTNSTKGISSEPVSFNAHEKYPFYLNLRPSLYSQFILMKRISLIFSYAVSQPLFLLIVRLNKLLSFWLDLHLAQANLGKIVYLIDYLINLRLKLFAKKHHLLLQNLKVLISAKLHSNCIYSSFCLHKSGNLVFTSISSHIFCRYYTLAKMHWIYLMKCLSN